MIIKQSRGAILSELLIVMAVFITGLVYLLSVVNFSLANAHRETRTNQAILLARESLEGVRSFRDNTDWAGVGLGSLATGVSYHLLKAGAPTTWSLVAGTKTIDLFTQDIVLGEVYRDGSDDIVEVAGVLDPLSKKITVTISWLEKSASQEIVLTSLLTDWRD